MGNFIDKNGLSYLWSKIKDKFVAKETGKGLSSNDFTTDDKTKLDGIATGANKTTVDSALNDTSANPVQNKVINAALKNKLDSATASTTYATKTEVGKKLDSATAETTYAKQTDLDLYATHLELGLYATKEDLSGKLDTTTANNTYSKKTDLDSYVKKTDIAGAYIYKGSVKSDANLPTTGQKAGDVYNIEQKSEYGGAGTNVAWTDKGWDALGGSFVIEALTNAEIDEVCV